MDGITPTGPYTVRQVFTINKRIYYIYWRGPQLGDDRFGLFNLNTGTIITSTSLLTELSGGITYTGKSNSFYHYANDYGDTGILAQLRLTI